MRTDPASLERLAEIMSIGIGFAAQTPNGWEVVRDCLRDLNRNMPYTLWTYHPGTRNCIRVTRL